MQFKFAFSIMKVQVVTKFWVYVQALRALNFFERSMRCMSNVNRKYKDRVFKFIFGNPENKAWTLSLYNAVNGSQYRNPDEIQLICMAGGQGKAASENIAEL